MIIQELFPTNLIVHECDFDLEQLEKECLEYKENHESINKSGKDSYQLYEYKNEKLENVIKDCIVKSQRGDRPFKSINIDSWVNINPPGSYNIMHQHGSYQGVFLSSVFYVKTPEDCGNIRFYDPRRDICGATDMVYYNNGDIYMWVKPIVNNLLLFPSWLWHDVEPNDSKENRISISSNIFVEW